MRFETLMRRTDKWREQYNPLRGLTIPRAVAMLEAGKRGEFADVQWTYEHVEETDDTLFALVERRTSAICELDWSIKTVPDDNLPKEVSKALVEEQRDFLREVYDRIDNLYEGIEFLAMATFRGFAHLQKHQNESGEVTHLEPLDQWNWVRDGLNGEWFWNPKALLTTADALRGNPESTIDPSHFIIRSMRRHVDRIALIAFIRKNLGEKDWTAFLEIYGIPSGVVTMGPEVKESERDEWLTLAKDVASGGSGVLPHGGVYTANDGPRGVNPFDQFMERQKQKVVLAGTGGLLTMLAESGSGTLAGNAHQETFEKIARAEARRISEVFQKQFDKQLLAAAFPNAPVLAYWELAANEEPDVGEACDHAQKLNSAGYRIAIEQLSEKTGYELEEKPQPEPPGLPGLPGAPGGMPGAARFFNRNAAGAQRLGKAVAEDLRKAGARLAEIEKIADAAEQRAALKRFLELELPSLKEEAKTNPKSAEAMEQELTAALITGWAEAARKRKETAKQ